MSHPVAAFAVNRIIAGTECRIGSLRVLGREIATPSCLQYTQLAALPHIEWQEAQKHLEDDEAMLLVPVVNSIRLAESIKKIGSSLASFANVPSDRLIFLSINDYLKGIPHGYNDSRGIAAITTGGKVQISSQNYFQIASSFKPQFIQSLCDSDAPIDASKKRVSHTVRRSNEYLHQLIQLTSDPTTGQPGQSNGNTHKETPLYSVFASIEGGFSQPARLESTKLCLEKGDEVSGFVIEGLTDSTALKSFDGEDEKYLKTVTPIIVEVLKQLPPSKPRALFGPLSPEFIWHFASLGIDLFDSSYACSLAESGQALLVEIKDEDGTGKNVSVSSSLLNLKEKMQFKEDFSVIKDSCGCLTCKRGFSRAYLCHLIDSREMLASTLLLHHNLHTLYSFLREIRKINPSQS